MFSNLSATFYIVFWITTSCSMILFNKAILSTLFFPYPIFLTTWHMIISTILTQLLSRTTNLMPAVKENRVDLSVIKTKVLPIAGLFAVSLICSNKAYIFLSVSYIQMLKASMPVVVLGLSLLGGLEKGSFIEFNIVTIISLGVALASIGELLFSWTGFFYQSFAIVAEGGRLVLTGVLLKQYKLDSLSTLFYVAPVCACFNFLCLYFLEWNQLPWERLTSSNFLLLLLVNGLVAFSLNIASVMLIAHTSALTLTLAGIVKDILLVVLSVLIFRGPVTLLQCLGYAVALLSLNLHKEFKKNRALFQGSSPVITATASPLLEKEEDTA